MCIDVLIGGGLFPPPIFVGAFRAQQYTDYVIDIMAGSWSIQDNLVSPD
jgi:hypothetical protein